MLCEKNMRILDDEIRRLEEKELSYQTGEKLCMLYRLRERMERERREWHKEEEHHPMTKEEAIRWVEGMHGEDPAVPVGAKWTMEQAKPIAIKYGVQPETQEFIDLWAAMNAMYSDYFGIAKKYNVVTPEFFADMAMAFLHDKDAKGNKLARYREYIAK